MGFDFAGVVISMFDAIILGNDLVGGVNNLQKSVQGFNTAAFDFAKDLNSTAIKPIAAAVLAIISVLELARIGSRFDGDQKLGVQQVATALIKAVLVIIAIQNVDLILGAINEVGDSAITSAGSVASNTVSGSGAVPTKEQLDEAGIGAQIGIFFLLIFPWLISLVAGIIIKVVVFVRFAEIYVLSAAATLPLVFMAHPETKGIAVGYLKKYAAAVLQGLVLIVIVKMFAFFKGQMGSFNLSNASDLFAETLKQVPAMMGSSVIFIFLIVSSGRLARALVGE